MEQYGIELIKDTPEAGVSTVAIGFQNDVDSKQKRHRDPEKVRRNAIREIAKKHALGGVATVAAINYESPPEEAVSRVVNVNDLLTHIYEGIENPAEVCIARSIFHISRINSGQFVSPVPIDSSAVEAQAAIALMEARTYLRLQPKI